MFQAQEEIVKNIEWNGEERVTIECKYSTWCGAKRKDFWDPESNWEKRIVVGSEIRMWTVQGSIVLGFELREKNDWVSVWCKANNFQYKAEREKADQGYVDFIKEEGKKIGKLIDKGKTLKEIDKLISKGHTGNTYAYALDLGISSAKNKKNAEKIRETHNKKYGVNKKDPKGKKGIVNPAVFTLEV